MITIDFIQDSLSASVSKCGYYTGLVYLSCGCVINLQIVAMNITVLILLLLLAVALEFQIKQPLMRSYL